MPPGQSDEILARQVLTDPDYRVRSAAARSAFHREPTEVLADALAKSIQSDKNVTVKKGAYKTLSRWAPSSPDALAALQWAAQNEAEEALRVMALKTVSVPAP